MGVRTQRAREASSAPATVNGIEDGTVGNDSQRPAHVGDGRLDAIEIRRARLPSVEPSAFSSEIEQQTQDNAAPRRIMQEAGALSAAPCRRTSPGPKTAGLAEFAYLARQYGRTPFWEVITRP